MAGRCGSIKATPCPLRSRRLRNVMGLAAAAKAEPPELRERPERQARPERPVKKAALVLLVKTVRPGRREQPELRARPEPTVRAVATATPELPGRQALPVLVRLVLPERPVTTVRLGTRS